jgi:hypothetical protein
MVRLRPARSPRRRVVHRIRVDCFARQPRVERIDERLTGSADTRCLERAAGEQNLDAGTRVARVCLMRRPRRPRVLDADLNDASRLSMPDYHVLVLLSECPEACDADERACRRSDFASHGLTRVVERLTRRALVQRVRS